MEPDPGAVVVVDPDAHTRSELQDQVVLTAAIQEIENLRMKVEDLQSSLEGLEEQIKTPADTPESIDKKFEKLGSLVQHYIDLHKGQDNGTH